jgi:hypothetical protein
MKCLNCGGTLYGVTPIVKLIPLADRGGSIKIGGLKVGQVDATESWNNSNEGWEWISRTITDSPVPVSDKDDDGTKLLRGPIYCLDCMSEHYYVTKSAKPLRLGSYFKACERGYAVVKGE